MRFVTVHLCPKCNADIGNRSANKSIIINGMEYSSPFERCSRCKRKIVRNNIYEPAFFLTKQEKLPLLLTNGLVLYPVMLLYTICGFSAFASLTSLRQLIEWLVVIAFVTLVWIGISALFYSRRKRLRDELIDTSRRRILHNVDYCYDVCYLYLRSEEEETFFTSLTNNEFAMLYKYICQYIEEDKKPPYRTWLNQIKENRIKRQ